MAEEKAGFDIEKLATPPLVHDSTLPAITDDIGAGAKTGVLVAVIGVPFEGAVPVYDATLGYCVWRAVAGTGLEPVTSDDGMGGFEIVFDEDGNIVYAE